MLALGAAAATGVVVIGVLASPQTLACVQRGDFAACMGETFLGGAPAQAVAEAPAAPESAAVVEADAAPATEPAPAMPAPDFDIVRVAPDGSAVIAGTGSPAGEIQLFADEEALGTETADAAGDWVFVTDQPLPAGGIELRVLDVESGAYADTSVIVVVQDDRITEPLVIASVPGEASEILQGLDQPEPARTATAAPEPAPQPESEPEAEPLAVAALEAETPAAPEPAPAAPLEAETPAAPIAVQAETSVAPEPVAAAPLEAQSEPPAAPAPAAAAPAAPVAEPAPAAPQPAPALVEAQPEPATAEAVAPATKQPAASAAVTEAPEVPQPVSPPATPVEPASAAPVPAPAPAEAVVAQAPAQPEPAAPVSPAALPEPTPAPAEPTPAAPAPAAPQPVETAALEEPAPEVQQPPAALAVTPPSIDAVEIDGDRNFFAGVGEDGTTIRLYVDNELVGSTSVRGGRWLVEATGALDGASQRVRADMLDAAGVVIGRAEVDFVLDLPAEIADEPVAVAESPAPAVPAPAPAAPAPVQAETPPEPAPAVSAPQAPEGPVAEPAPQPVAETPTDPAEAPQDDVPVLVGVTAEGGRTTSGLAIIRQGDNLWSIARRVYGEGIRYTQIFEANEDQIRNPDLIYPGQVFDLPGTDAVIGGEAGEP